MKDPSYFQHDYNARNDEKILMIRSEFNNAEGYGIYWMLIESMAETKDGYLNKEAIAPLSLSYSLAKEKVDSFVTFCIKVGLFFLKEKKFSSHRMVAHKKFRVGLSRAGIIGSQARWRHSPPNGQANGQANGPPNGTPNAKERKGKERKKNRVFDKNLLTGIPEDLVKSAPAALKWLEYKQQKGHRYKKRGLDAFWEYFRSIPEEKRMEAVNWSMANNWAGLFMRKDNGKNSFGREKDDSWQH